MPFGLLWARAAHLLARIKTLCYPFTAWGKTPRFPRFGAVAQLGARLNGIQKVSGSNPLSSTKRKPCPKHGFFFCLETKEKT